MKSGTINGTIERKRSELPETLRHPLTFGTGKVFAHHEQLASDLKLDIYLPRRLGLLFERRKIFWTLARESALANDREQKSLLLASQLHFKFERDPLFVGVDVGEPWRKFHFAVVQAARNFECWLPKGDRQRCSRDGAS